ncbi:MAG: hypothetical protein NZ455_00075 [Bacteroidia bacterium]|nr:hypothetical protein [Bacteroidia bacterium]MDW8348553.1 hypothetical protein [Bacteroidia bacterium]
MRGKYPIVFLLTLFLFRHFYSAAQSDLNRDMIIGIIGGAGIMLPGGSAGAGFRFPITGGMRFDFRMSNYVYLRSGTLVRYAGTRTRHFEATTFIPDYVDYNNLNLIIPLNLRINLTPVWSRERHWYIAGGSMFYAGTYRVNRGVSGSGVYTGPYDPNNPVYKPSELRSLLYLLNFNLSPGIAKRIHRKWIIEAELEFARNYMHGKNKLDNHWFIGANLGIFYNKRH